MNIQQIAAAAAAEAEATEAAAIAATTREESDLLWDLARTRRATADHYAALAR